VTREEVLEAQLAEACDRVRAVERESRILHEENARLVQERDQARRAFDALHVRFRDLGGQL
jgi:FtsZ-binding cell division protein ZapB